MKRYNIQPTIGLEVLDGADIRATESPDGKWIRCDDESIQFTLEVLHSLAYDIHHGNGVDELDLRDITSAIKRLTGNEWNPLFRDYLGEQE